MKCCPCCFGDKFLFDRFFPQHSIEKGVCSYCHSPEMPLLEPAKLADVFAPLVSIYEAVPVGGALLVEWLRGDWGIFDNKNIDVPSAQSLLAEILDDGEIVRRRFAISPQYKYEGDSLDLRWDELRDELMHKNRYFPEAVLDEERLAWVFLQLSINKYPGEWYRARIQQGLEIYPLDQMGAPPKAIAAHGRANPPGIPYLYLGANEETAVSEIRPHTGELVCVAKFRLPEDLHLVDLTDPRRLISPLQLGDEDDIAEIRRDIPFIERLGKELAKPVLPQRAAIDYVPSQYLCEFIKKSGYDGVLYSGSVGKGVNLALFNPSKAQPQMVCQRRIVQVNVRFENVS